MTMSPAQEKNYLSAVLRRAQNGPSRLFAGFWGPAFLWLSLVATSVIALAVAPLLPIDDVALVFFMLGCAWSYVAFRFSAARYWPVHSRYLNRQAIEARLTELGPNSSSKQIR